MTDLGGDLRASLGRLVVLDVPTSPGPRDAALPGASASAPGPADPAEAERLEKLAALAGAEPSEPDGAAVTKQAYFTELDRPVRPDTRAAMGPGATLSEARAPDYAAPSTEGAGTEAARGTVGETARTRFSWEEAAPDEESVAPPRRFSWEPAAPAAAPSRFSWDPPAQPSARRTGGRASYQEPAPALVPRGWIPAGPLTPPLEIELPEMAPTRDAEPVAMTPELRRHQLALRVHVCRDAYRVLGELGATGDALRAPGRTLTALDELLDPDAKAGARDGAGALADPEPYVERLGPDALTRLDRLLTELEDTLLELDEHVTPGLFRERIEQKRRSRTMLARYARLLASRRFNAGQRRDRFEWLATRLLTVRSSPSERVMLPRDEARSVLKHLIGGFSVRAPAQELAEAIEHLKESLTRLDDVRTPDELFDTGIFLDVHGYKVSMRDHLLSPDFLYLSVAIDAKVENMLETWIAYLERAEPSRAVESSSARARVYRLLADQEAEVDRIFGVRRVTDEELAAATREPERPKPKKEEKKAGRRFELPVFAFDRALATLGGLALLTVASLATVLVSTGTIETTKIVPVQAEEIVAYSPYLQGGYLVGSGEDQYLHARLSSGRWRALSKPARWAAAEQLAKVLSERGTHNAEVLLDNATVIVIRKGQVTKFPE